MPRDKNIFFIGRLEKEKWAEILLDVIKYSLKHQFWYVFTVIGEGSYRSHFVDFPREFVHVLGKLPRNMLTDRLKKEADVLFMPSLFLETFGLVALEALEAGVPVIGFREWGLVPFIPESLAIRRESPVSDFFRTLERGLYERVDIEQFSYDSWQRQLGKLTEGYNRILCVHDYDANVGGAEVYFHVLQAELRKLWKTVDSYSYEGSLSGYKRWYLFLSAPFRRRQKNRLAWKIREFRPDMIFSNSVLRYVGMPGIQAIRESGVPHFMMHHDLGLVTPRPSQVFSLSDLPDDISWKSWNSHTWGFFGKILGLYKWWIVKNIWKTIPTDTLHLVPSEWMMPVLQKYTSDSVQVFSHTIFPK